MKNRALGLFALLMTVCMLLPLSLPLTELGLRSAAEESEPVTDPSYNDVDPNDPENIAYHKPTRANVVTKSSERVVDGDTSTYWSGVDYPKYVDIDLMDNYEIKKIIVHMPTSTAKAYQYALYGSLDGVNFTRLAKTELEKPKRDGDSFLFETPVCYRVIRVNVLANSAGASQPSQIAEVRIYGEKSGSTVIPTRETMEFVGYDQWLLENACVNTASLPKTGTNGDYAIDDTYTDTDTISAVRGLITRILGDRCNDWFDLSIAPNPKGNGYDYFELTEQDGKIRITGNEGVSLAVGLNHYLKYYCYVDVAQQTSNAEKLPESAPRIDKTVFRETPLEVRYAYNYCTLSYTMPFFGYDDWQRELDYLMLQGVNLVLDTTATEALWIAYLQHYGYSAYEALDYVCGYSYKAWWLMGNLYGYGGNVSDQWVYDTLEMARVNQRYMTVMGAEPCLQAFVGTLPVNFAEKANDTLTGMGFSEPRSYITGTGNWVGFVRPFVLNTTYDGYETMAEDFYAVQRFLYGPVTDYYAGDFFHEIDGKPPAAFDKASMSADTLAALMRSDKDGVWILQAWWSNPLPEVLEGFGEYRTDHILILDLSANDAPRWNDTSTWGGKEFGGTSWVYSILDNFGGRPGVHGNLEKTAKNIYKAMTTAKHMKGIGITPEGTQQNSVVYELYWEAIWCDEKINVSSWISEYAHRRYGMKLESTEKAWQLLAGNYGVFETNTADGANVNYAINNNPSFAPGANEGGYFEGAFRIGKLEQALDLLMKDFDLLCDNANYIDDLVDLFRLELSERTTAYISKMKAAIKDKDYASFVAYGDLLFGAMKLIDEVSSYQKDELFGVWIGRTDAWIKDPRTGEYDDYAVDMMHINAKALLTMWASAPIVNYAYRQYNGLMADYYYTMWHELYEQILPALARGTTVNDSLLSLSGARCFEIAWSIVTSDKTYSVEISDAGGEGAGRGLKAIYTEIKQNYYNAVKPQILPAEIRFTDASGYRIRGKKIEGIVDGTTVAELVAAMQPHLGSLKITVDGKEVAEGACLKSGAVVRLENETGKQLQKLTIGTLLYNAEQLSQKREILENFLAELDGKKPTADCAERVDSAVTAITEGLEAGITQDNADALVALVTETMETISFQEKAEFPIVPVAIGGAALLLIMLVCICIGKKKTKKN